MTPETTRFWVNSFYLRKPHSKETVCDDLMTESIKLQITMCLLESRLRTKSVPRYSLVGMMRRVFGDTALHLAASEQEELPRSITFGYCLIVGKQLVSSDSKSYLKISQHWHEAKLALERESLGASL